MAVPGFNRFLKSLSAEDAVRLLSVSAEMPFPVNTVLYEARAMPVEMFSTLR